MNENKPQKKHLLEVFAVTLFVTYGIHSFCSFFRKKYTALIGMITAADPGLQSVLTYTGHLIILAFFLFFIYAVRSDRKYFKMILPGNGGNRISKLLAGMLFGFAMNAGCIACAALHGDISFSLGSDFNLPLFVLAFFAVLIQASVEEFESRLFFFEKLSDGGFSLIPAAVLSGLFFSYLHVNNTGFGIVAFISIFISGIQLVLIYRYTDSIWTACGYHQMWNFTQNFIFGLPNSGVPSGLSFFTGTVNGNSFFYDEVFGVEGSYFSIAAVALATLILFFLLKKKEAR